MAATKTSLEFVGSQGVTLSATLDAPGEGEERPRAYAVFAHCFTCTKDFLAPSRIGRALAERGVAVLRFDFTGLGQSCGEFAETGFETNVADVEAAADFLRERYDAPRLLIGHSLGGAAVMAAASRVPEVRAVASIAAPSRSTGLRSLLAPVAETIRAEGSAEVSVAGRHVVVGRRLLDDLAELGPARLVGDLRAALLLLHAPADETVEIGAAAELFAAARHPKSFVSLDTADHLLSRREDALWAAAVVDAWSARYLGA
jgi:putative redox protein